jgi:hypothetical protein
VIFGVKGDGLLNRLAPYGHWRELWKLGMLTRPWLGSVPAFQRFAGCPIREDPMGDWMTTGAHGQA